MNIKSIEEKAKRIMYKSPNELKKSMHGKKLPLLYYHILEDANMHGENRVLSSMGVFGKTRTTKYEHGTVITPLAYGNPNVRKQFEEYRRKGGRSYNL